MLLCGNFTFRGLGGIDKVEDEYSHNKGAEGVEQYIAEAHGGARAASTALRAVEAVSGSLGCLTPGQTLAQQWATD